MQIECFGIHAECDGTMLYGLHVDSIMDRIRDKLSVDYLCRVIVDVQQVGWDGVPARGCAWEWGTT